jgi:hypothetical protein
LHEYGVGYCIRRDLEFIDHQLAVYIDRETRKIQKVQCALWILDVQGASLV